MRRRTGISSVRLPLLAIRMTGVTDTPESTLPVGATIATEAASIRARTRTVLEIVSLLWSRSLASPVEQRITLTPSSLAVQSAKSIVSVAPAGMVLVRFF